MRDREIMWRKVSEEVKNTRTCDGKGRLEMNDIIPTCSCEPQDRKRMTTLSQHTAKAVMMECVCVCAWVGVCVVQVCLRE